MNTNEFEREARLQAAAEQAERDGLAAGDPGIDRYRLVIRAVRQAAMPGFPEDFARRVSARTTPAAEQVNFEDGAVTLLLLAMALGGGGYFLPRFWPLISSLVNLPKVVLPNVSWPLLVAAAFGLGLAWAIDRAWGQRSGGMPA